MNATTIAHILAFSAATFACLVAYRKNAVGLGIGAGFMIGALLTYYLLVFLPHG